MFFAHQVILEHVFAHEIIVPSLLEYYPYLHQGNGFVIFYVNFVVELPLHHSKYLNEIWLHLLPHYIHHCPNALNITFASSLVCFHQSHVVWKN